MVASVGNSVYQLSAIRSAAWSGDGCCVMSGQGSRLGGFLAGSSWPHRSGDGSPVERRNIGTWLELISTDIAAMGLDGVSGVA
jgi:hypothetical protein